MSARRMFLLSLATLLALALAGCNAPAAATPTAFFLPTPEEPTITAPPDDTATPTQEATAEPLPTATDQPAATATTGAVSGPVIQPGSPSGPYAVLLVMADDVLNIRSGPGVGYPLTASFAPTAVNIMRTGPSARVGDSIWVEVQRPGGGTGWVNSHFLTEYVSPDVFCADARIPALLNNLGASLAASNGTALAALGSPTHGVDVRLWRHEANINFDREHLRWVFSSTYSHSWGAAPGSGFPVSGSFKDVVLPRLLEVFNSPYEKTCNDVGIAAAFSMQPWPLEYSSINYFQVLKPATAGIEMDWRIWLVGVEYVGGQPYVFTLIHYEWEP